MQGYIPVGIMTKKVNTCKTMTIGKPVRLVTDSEENVKKRNDVKILLKPHCNPKYTWQAGQAGLSAVKSVTQRRL